MPESLKAAFFVVDELFTIEARSLQYGCKNYKLEMTSGQGDISLRKLQEMVRPKLNGGRKEDIYDVIVIGVGSMGSSTCYHLAKQGLKVLGLDQFDIPHELGAHTGQSRIIRQAYFEHPNYVPLLKSAYNNWSQLEQVSSTQLFFKTGLLYFGPEDHFLIKDSQSSARQFGLEMTSLSHDQQASAYPQFEMPQDFIRMVEVNAGFLTPERAILTFLDQAVQNGAVIQTHEPVLEWKRAKGMIEVKTQKHTYSCKKLVLSSGAWTSQLSTLDGLEVTRQIIAWAHTSDPELFQLDHFPTWTYADPAAPGIYYGFPALPTATFGGPEGVKIAHHTKGVKTDPERVNREVSKEEQRQLLDAVKTFVPGVESISACKTCLYTNSPDDHFIIDFHPQDEDVVVAAGFSGHGFKFASIVGEVLSDLVTSGNSKHPIDFLRLQR